MAKRTHRLLFVMVALGAAVLVILLLVWLGSHSKGPLASLLDRAGAMVTNVEGKIILDQRSDKRKDRLDWFQSWTSDPGIFSRTKSTLYGVYDNTSTTSFEKIFNLEQHLRTTFPLIHLYSAWGSKPEEAFPEKMVNAIYDLGSIPVITWEPWLSDFSGEEIKGLREPEKRDKGGLADIAKGVYDSYITAWASAAKETGKVIFIRFGHEMNDPYRYPWGPQNNKARDFTAAWIHVHKLFDALGAKNVIWIWSPHPSYGWFDAFYPGDEYVDWVGLNILNYGTVAHWSQWWTFREMFGTHYAEFTKYKKPIMITEFGCLAVGGDRAVWFDQAMTEISRDYPAVRSILFFNVSADKTTTEQSVDWTFADDPMVVATIRRHLLEWNDTVQIAYPE